MKKVLCTRYYNNGYQCSCCHADWKETEWIDPLDMLTKEQIENLISKSKGEFEGEIYEWDGEEIGGYWKFK